MEGWVGRQVGRQVVGAAVVGAGLGAVVLARAAGQHGAAPVWSALSLVVAVLAGMALATYLPQPERGTRLELGCGSCAVAGGLMALGAAWLVAVEAPTTGNALLALALAGAALAGRLSRPSACVLTAGPGPTGGEATTASPACGDHPGTARATRTAVSGIREDGRHGTDAGGRGG